MNSKALKIEAERREYYNRMAPFPIFDTEIINDIKKLSMITAKDNSNRQPVTYCKTCLSIKIKTVDIEGSEEGIDYCVTCSNTDMDTTHISEWEDMYEEKYGERFLTSSKNTKKK